VHWCRRRYRRREEKSRDDKGEKQEKKEVKLYRWRTLEEGEYML